MTKVMFFLDFNKQNKYRVFALHDNTRFAGYIDYKLFSWGGGVETNFKNSIYISDWLLDQYGYISVMCEHNNQEITMNDTTVSFTNLKEPRCERYLAFKMPDQMAELRRSSMNIHM